MQIQGQICVLPTLNAAYKLHCTLWSMTQKFVLYSAFVFPLEKDGGFDLSDVNTRSAFSPCVCIAKYLHVTSCT